VTLNPMIMASAIEVLAKQAMKTFGDRFCQKSLDKLWNLMNKITAEDVKLDKNILDYVSRQPAPMCVMDIFENKDITIAIFILKHGVTMPMHDHPGMHGLLKVKYISIRYMTPCHLLYTSIVIYNI